MPTAQQILALVKSHVRGDDERFYSLVLQLAATEAKRGHTAVAEELKELLDNDTRRTSIWITYKRQVIISRSDMTTKCLSPPRCAYFLVVQNG
jgi:hypothetical protein